MKAFVAFFLLVFAPTAVIAGRYEDHKRKASRGPHLEIVTSTYSGRKDNDYLTDAVQLEDGRILTAGYTVRYRRSSRNEEPTPFIQAYAPQLKERHGRMDFPEGSGTFTAAHLPPDGQSVYIAGLSGKRYRNMDSKTSKREGRGDGFLLSLRIGDGSIEWITRFSYGSPPKRIFTDIRGNIYVANSTKGHAQLVIVSSEGSIRAEYGRHASNKGGFFTTDPTGEHVLFGSDRNTHTGVEPWRQPYFFKYHLRDVAAGRPEPAERYYEWEPNTQIRGDGRNGASVMVSDSSIVDAAYASDGSLFLAAWSDGGNSILTCQPDSLSNRWEGSGLGISTWGMRGANSLSWLLKWDPVRKQTITGTQWVTFLPEGFENGPGNIPNALLIDELKTLFDGGPVITGRAATGLIPTPNALWMRPDDYTGRYNGLYVTAFNPKLNRILFSSFLPGYESSRIVPVMEGLLILGTTRMDDGVDGVRARAPTTPDATQREFAGGLTDGHLVFLKHPDYKHRGYPRVQY